MNLIIDTITVVDLTNKEAKKIELCQGKNFITSSGNHYGKSVMMKSIYYTLGAEVFFPNMIKELNLLTIVSFHIGQNQYRVSRLKNAFVVYENDRFIDRFRSVGAFAEKLSEIFDLKIELVGKDEEGTIVQCPPAIYFMPYYVDQENGWANNSFSFNRMGQFDELQRKDSYFFHLGVLDKEYVENKKVKKSNEKAKKKIEKDIERYKTVIDTLKLGIEDVDMSFDSDRLEEAISNRKNEINDLLKQLSNTRGKLIATEDEYQRLQSEKDILSKYLNKKVSEKDVDGHRIECPRCGLFFEPVGLENLEKQYLIESLNDDYIKTVQELYKLEKSIEKYKLEFAEYQRKLDSFEKTLVDDQDLYNSYLTSKTTYKLLDDYYAKIALGIRKLEELEKSNNYVKDSLKKYGNARKTANERYLELLNHQLDILDIPSNQIEAESEPGTKLSASGAYGPRGKIAQMLSFVETQTELAKDIISFPLVIDSPNSLEQDKDHFRGVLETLFQWDRSENQIIVASIDGKTIAREIEEVKYIDVTGMVNHIMTTSEYQIYEEEINNVMMYF